MEWKVKIKLVYVKQGWKKVYDFLDFLDMFESFGFVAQNLLLKAFFKLHL